MQALLNHLVIGVLAMLAFAGPNADELSDRDVARLEEAAAELRADLDGLIERYDGLLTNEWLTKYAVPTHLARAERAVERLIVDRHVDPLAVSEFHWALSTFADGLEDLPDWKPGVSGWADIKAHVEKPSVRDCNGMSGALQALLDEASRNEEFAPTEKMSLGRDATAGEVRAFNERVMACLHDSLFSKRLEPVSSEGLKETKAFMDGPLAELREALGLIADARDPVFPDRPDAPDAVERARTAMKALVRDGKEFARQHTWAARRVDRMEPYLESIDAQLSRLRNAPRGLSTRGGRGVTGSDADEFVKDIQEDLALVVATYDDVLSNEWVATYAAPTHLTRATDALERLAADGDIDPLAVNDFHCGIVAFATALRDLPTSTPNLSSWRTIKDSVEKPARYESTGMARALFALSRKAARRPEFVRTEAIELSGDATADAVATYFERAMTCVERALTENPLYGRSTEAARKAEEIVIPTLTALRTALDQLEASRTGGDLTRSEHEDIIERVRVAIDDVRRAGKELARQHAPSGGRVEQMTGQLELLDENLGRLKTLR